MLKLGDRPCCWARARLGNAPGGGGQRLAEHGEDIAVPGAHGQRALGRAAEEQQRMRPLQGLHVGARAAHTIEGAIEIEAALAGPGELHDLDIFGGAPIALFLGSEVAIALLLGVTGARDDVQGDPPLGEVIEGRDLAGRQRRSNEARTVRNQESQPFSTLGGILGDQEPLG
jgi:hypothetical protein